MKIEGLIDEINDCTSYKARIDGKMIYLLTSSEDCLATFSCDVNYLSDIKFNYRFLDCEPNVKCYDLGNFYALLNLINDFVNTPIEKRYPEKKYRLRWIDDRNGKTNYVYLDINATWHMITLGDFADTFTESELEQLKKDNPRFAPAIDAMKEPVGNEDE